MIPVISWQRCHGSLSPLFALVNQTEDKHLVANFKQVVQTKRMWLVLLDTVMSFLVSVRRSDCLAPELHDDSIAQLNVLSEQLDLVPAGPQPQPFTGLTRKGETNVSGELEVTCVYGTQSQCLNQYHYCHLSTLSKTSWSNSFSLNGKSETGLLLSWTAAAKKSDCPQDLLQMLCSTPRPLTFCYQMWGFTAEHNLVLLQHAHIDYGSFYSSNGGFLLFPLAWK